MASTSYGHGGYAALTIGYHYNVPTGLFAAMPLMHNSHAVRFCGYAASEVKM
jgi:hypothetical protein